MQTQDLRYPIGKYQKPDTVNSVSINSWISDIEELPKLLRDKTSKLTDKQLSWKYRPDGWSIRQVVHHCADSHINSIVRFKLTLTEDEPTIKPYFEDRWAKLPDTTEPPVEWSLMLLDGLHKKWVYLLRSLNEEDWKKVFVHPEHGRKVSIGENIALYAWHCKHHLAHIDQALKHQGEFN